MAARRWRIFLDTSALIAGIVSTHGAAHEVLRLGEAGIVEILVSRQVLTEADRNFTNKLPAFVHDYRHFIRKMAPTLLEDPSVKSVVEAADVIHHKDAPILAAEINGEVDFLITWNTKHFHKQSVTRSVQFKIRTPGEFLKEFRETQTPS